MYTQRLENPHNALWESLAEWIPASRQKMAPAAESSFMYFRRARPRRNTKQVQINFKLTIRVYT